MAQNGDLGAWFREFIRVETDRFLLFVLTLVLIVRHAPDAYVMAVVGGLIMSIQNSRYPRDPGRKPPDPPKGGTNAATPI